MMKKISLLIAGALLSGAALAGSLETNLSGLFLKGNHAELRMTGLSNSGVNFKLAAGNIVPGDGCANGPAGCVSLWGWATRTDKPEEFLYANENGQCVFYIRNEPQTLVIHGLKGGCGTNEENRAALKAVEGVYTPRP